MPKIAHTKDIVRKNCPSPKPHCKVTWPCFGKLFLKNHGWKKIMQKKRLTLVWLVTAILCAGGVRAATYYVAQEDPKAADTNAGTIEAPWKTIGRCLKNFAPGDTLYIKKGAY